MWIFVIIEYGSVYAVLSTPNVTGFYSHSIGLEQIHEIRVDSFIVGLAQNRHGMRIRKHVPSEQTEPNIEGDFSHTIDCVALFSRLEGDEQNSLVIGLNFAMDQISYHGLCRSHHLWDYDRLGKAEWLEDKTKLVAPVVTER